MGKPTLSNIKSALQKDAKKKLIIGIAVASIIGVFTGIILAVHKYGKECEETDWYEPRD